MTSSAPWSVKGIDPNAREAAKEQARRAGMTLGEWLTHRIHIEGEDEPQPEHAAQGPLAKALDRLTSRIEMAEQRSTLAVTGIDQSVRGVLARLEVTERDQISLGARFEGALQDVTQTQSALVQRVEQLEEHTAGPRSIEAIKGLEGSIARLANQVYDGEGRQRETLADLRRDFGGLGARLEQVERAAPGAADPAAGKVVERLDQAQARTTAALRDLETSFAQLDRRLGASETRLESGGLTETLNRRLSEMAANLAGSVEASRIEMAEQLRASADGRFDRMDQALKDMDAHVQAAEQRSADAIERMGREVLRVAEALQRKVQTSEQRAADAIDQVGGEVARVVGALDGRLQRTETTQGLALEKLGADITRITERLTERIGVAERRAAQGIDDVGEQINRVTERLNQRYDRSASDLAERIRQSEERTVRLLEDARMRLDGRLAGSERKAEAFEAPPFPETSTSIPASAAGGPPQYVIYPDVAPFGQAIAPHPLNAQGFTPVAPDFPAPLFPAPHFEAEDIDAASDFPAPAHPQSEADFIDEPPAFVEPVYDETAEGRIIARDLAEDDLMIEDGAEPMAPPPPAAAEQAGRALSTRELIEQARASARAGQAERGGGSRLRRQDAHRTAAGAGFGGVPFVTRRKKKDRTRTVLAASFVLAAMMLTGGGLIYVAGGMPDQLAKLSSPRATPAVVTPAVEPAPRMAVVLDPTPITPGDGLTPGAAAAPAKGPTPSSSQDAGAMLNKGRLKIEAKDKSGLDQVRGAANLGDPEAQRYLGNLYKDGKAGLTKDLTQARRWFERAADGGDRTAMHETALLQFNGEGGPKNQTSAAEWFHRAADLGSTDSQFNLGVLYESGAGVAKNPAEAYKWYLLATRDTDEAKRDQARDAADRVKGLISPDAQGAAEKFVASFVPQTPNVASAPSQVASAPR